MTPNEIRLRRLLARFKNAVDVAQALWAEAADRDAAFDGGEWSGPACWDAFERDQDAIARRLGFANATVAYTVAAALGVNTPNNVYGMWNDPAWTAPLPR